MTKSARKRMTWGQIYYANLGRGYDHGYAAFRADEAERERKRAAMTQAMLDRILEDIDQEWFFRQLEALAFHNSDTEVRLMATKLLINLRELQAEPAPRKRKTKNP